MAAMPREALLTLPEIKRMANERSGSFGGVEHGPEGLTLRLAFWTVDAVRDFVQLLDVELGGSRAGDVRVIGARCERRVTREGRAYVEARIVVDPARLG